jgi:hypothetical protein
VVLAIKVAMIVIFAAVYCSLLVRVVVRGRDSPSLLVTMGWSAIFLFLLAAGWYRPWYSAVLVTFAALTFDPENEEARFFRRTALVYAWSSTSYYVLSVPGATQLMLLAASVITVAFPLSMLARNRHLLHEIFVRPVLAE